jgi:hypothetical protein
MQARRNQKHFRSIINLYSGDAGSMIDFPMSVSAVRMLK